MTDFDKKLEEVNARLRGAKLRVSIFQRQNKLWLRATLPPKPHIRREGNYQQAVSINCNATIAGLKYAEQKAKQMAVELDTGAFDWARWIEVKPDNEEPKIIHEWINKFHEHKASTSALASSTWKFDYLGVGRKLPQQEELSVEVLIKFIFANSKPDTRTRKRLVGYCAQLAEFALLPSKEIRTLEGSYSAKSVNPRALPSDEEIQDFVDSIKEPGWKWIIAAIATYGLRSHEAFFTDLARFPKIRVTEGKTGARVIQPLYPEWAPRWNLQNKILPSYQKVDAAHEEYTLKISAWMCRNSPFKALDLRHCYARRCFQFGFDPTQSAKLMGHSWQIHLQTYRAWIDEEVYDKAYLAKISNPNRPLPPN
ncbi:MAG: integrase [Calothrix sp. FI2-JRJ7]|nr:integrase [Calothrix sp. FI2-JRJ7]